MNKGVVNLRLQGRFGNQLFQYAFARAYAEAGNLELRTDPWDGEILFNVKHPRIQERFSDVRNELTAVKGEPNIELQGYFQMQRCLIYTRSQVKKWLQWVDGLCYGAFLGTGVHFHIRRGDFADLGYPLVSASSYVRWAERFCAPTPYTIVTEENPAPSPKGLPPYAADFVRLSMASHLFRANSSFSWWAATLASKDQEVFSPVIEGLKGGEEHDCEFVRGNHPRLCNLDFVTNLHLDP